MLAYVFAQWYRKERQEEDDDLSPAGGGNEQGPLNPAAKS
jgi:putative membrane protein